MIEKKVLLRSKAKARDFHIIHPHCLTLVGGVLLQKMSQIDLQQESLEQSQPIE